VRNIAYHDNKGVCFAEGYSIYRHETMMSQKPGTYAIIANLELAKMQGANRCHIAAVPDDFGNLVAVPGGGNEAH